MFPLTTDPAMTDRTRLPVSDSGVAESSTARNRLMDAVVVCVDRVGLAGFALEDVATEAGLSRATIYRHFTGGRDQLIRETVTREVGRFWGQLADRVSVYPDIESRLVHGIIEARRMVVEYDLLQRLLAVEPEQILPALLSSEPLVQQVLRDYTRDLLDSPDLLDGVDLDESADYLTRMILAHVGTTGQWDLADEAQVRRLVQTQFLAGVMAPGGRRPGR